MPNLFLIIQSDSSTYRQKGLKGSTFRLKCANVKAGCEGVFLPKGGMSMKGYHYSKVPKTVSLPGVRLDHGTNEFVLWLHSQLRRRGVGVGRRAQLNYLSKRLHLSSVVSGLLLSGYVLPDDPLWLKLQQVLGTPNQDEVSDNE